jgi:hypothetical protein
MGVAEKIKEIEEEMRRTQYDSPPIATPPIPELTHHRTGRTKPLNTILVSSKESSHVYAHNF